MTYKQNEQWRKLQQSISDAYKAFQDNTDKAKHESLSQAWQKAIVKEEKFTARFN